MSKNYVFALMGMFLSALAIFANLSGVSAAPQAQPGPCQGIEVWIGGPTNVYPGERVTFSADITNFGEVEYDHGRLTFSYTLGNTEYHGHDTSIGVPNPLPQTVVITDTYTFTNVVAFTNVHLAFSANLSNGEYCLSESPLQLSVYTSPETICDSYGGSFATSTYGPTTGTVGQAVSGTSHLTNHTLEGVEEAYLQTWFGQGASDSEAMSPFLPGDVITTTYTVTPQSPMIVEFRSFVHMVINGEACRFMGQPHRVTVFPHQIYMPIVTK